MVDKNGVVGDAADEAVVDELWLTGLWLMFSADEVALWLLRLQHAADQVVVDQLRLRLTRLMRLVMPWLTM